MNLEPFLYPLHLHGFVSCFQVRNQLADIDHPHRFAANEIRYLIGIDGGAHNQVNIVGSHEISSQAGGRVVIRREIMDRFRIAQNFDGLPDGQDAFRYKMDAFD